MATDVEQRAYQRFFPECRADLGFPNDPFIVAIDARRVADPLSASAISGLPPEDLFLREEPQITEDVAATVDGEQTQKLAALIESGFLPAEYKIPLQIIPFLDEYGRDQAELHQRRVALFLETISGKGWPVNREGTRNAEPPKDSCPFVARSVLTPDIAINILISLGEPLYEHVKRLYETQREKTGEIILPFDWFFHHDMYYYRGVWWIQGRPDQKQDGNDYIEPNILRDVVLPSSFIFRLGPPPPFEDIPKLPISPPSPISEIQPPAKRSR